MNIPHYDKFLAVQSKLYRFALSLTKNVNEAEDIQQETLIKLWQLRREWPVWQNFEAYAMRMVRNEFLNYIRKNTKRSLVDLDNVAAHTSSMEADAKIALSDLKLRFVNLISKLPEVQRNIIYLREIEEMEYKEIAEVLEITEAKVKVYLFRGRQYLKNKINGKR